MNSQTSNLVLLANELETFIQLTVPKCINHSKYGGTLFTLKPEEKEGQFCGVFIYAQHVQLSFSQGASLKDSKKLLKGSGKYRRHVNFESVSEIDFVYLEKLLKQAAEL